MLKSIDHLNIVVDDIKPLHTQLRGAGVAFFSDVQRVHRTQLTYADGVRKRLDYFQDPEGNLLELREFRS